MNETKLKSPSKKENNYSLKAFLLGIAVSAIFIVPLMIYYKGMFIYYGDYNFQVLPFYELMADAVHNKDIGWNWYTDLGSSFVGSYSFYNLGSPFFWVLLLFPSKAIPYVMGPLTMLKFGISSLTAYIYLKRYTKNKNNAVLGAVLYAFSGAATYNMVFHFIDSMALFPLLLATLDMYVYDKKKGLFAITAFLCAITNYYLFIGEVVFCIIYWAVRNAVKSYKMSARDVFYLIFEGFIGSAMSMFILLPTLYQIVGNGRANDSGLNGGSFWVYQSGYSYMKILVSLFMPPDPPQWNIYVSSFGGTWHSITAYLPLFGMAGVFAVVFNKNKNKWIRVFYAVCLIFMMFPVLNSSFGMFTSTQYTRWFFMLLLIMAQGSVMALEDPSTQWKKSIITNLVLSLCIILIVGFMPVQYQSSVGRKYIDFGLSDIKPIFWVYSAIAVINIAVCILFVSLYKRNRTSFQKYGALMLIFAILTVTDSTVAVETSVNCKENLNPLELGHLGVTTDDLGIDDIDNWRSDVVSNSSYSTKMYDYDNTATEDFAVFFPAEKEYISNTIAKDKKNSYTQEDNAILGWHLMPFGIFHSIVSSSVTKLYEGLGFTRVTLSNLPMGMYGMRTLTGTKYLFNQSDNPLSVTDENGDVIIPGYKYLKSWNGYDIYENEYAVPIGTTYDKFMFSTDFENIPSQYRHLVLLDTIVVDSFEQTWNFVEVKMKQASPEDYNFTQAEYFENCSKRIESAVYDFKKDTKGFEAKINIGEVENGADGKYVFFSVPYDSGWSAKVNGEKAKIEVVDYGFMAVKVPANQESTIRFNYHTPGSLYGIFTSVVCGIMLLLYVALNKIRENDELSNKAVTENSVNVTIQEDFLDMSVFDIVKQTEEDYMMHVYKRVPVVLERGSGAVGYDMDDKKYIDFTSGIGVNALGYANGSWINAVEKQLRNIQHASNLYYNPTQIQLAEMLCMKTGFSKVFFANSGAEANECAIKIARKYGNDKFGEKHTHIVTLENSFHGRTITTLSATGQDVFHKYFQPFTDGFSYAKANSMESIKSAVNENTCAVMIELIQGEGGVNPLNKDFVKELADFCKENDILLIVDEIQTGVGRTGKLYCYENYDIIPDVITSAKALGGGLPLSACLCNEKLKDVLTPGSNGTTFGGNPIACAGGLYIVETISDETFLAEVSKKGEYMRKRISEMDGVKEVRGLGLMIGIVLENNNSGEVLNKCAENGLLVLTANGLIRLLPPLNIEWEDINEGLEILAKSISQSNQSEKTENKEN